MSRYTYRFVEVKFSNLCGIVNDENCLPKSPKKGSIYKIRDDKSSMPYREFINGEWSKTNTYKTWWDLIDTYTPIKNNYGSLAETNSEKNCVLRDEDGNPIIVRKNEGFVNNGGVIRDDYISENNFNCNEYISGRGLPDDISPRLKNIIDKYEPYIYGKTWVYLDEWYDIYDKEIKNLTDNIKDKYKNNDLSKINDKLNNIIRRLDDISIETKNNDNDEELTYETNDYINDSIEDIESIAIEIGRIIQICEQTNDFYQLNNNVRIIYFIG